MNPGERMTDVSPLPDTPESWGTASRGDAERVAPLLMRPFADRMVERLKVSENDAVLEVRHLRIRVRGTTFALGPRRFNRHQYSAATARSGSASRRLCSSFLG